MDPVQRFKAGNRTRALRSRHHRESRKKVPISNVKSIGKRRFHRKRRGRNWLKFQLDRKRYQIGFPVGCGAFSVVYFAKFQNISEDSPPAPPPTSCIRKVADPDEANENPAERNKSDIDLPHYVAVKVINLDPKLCNSRQRTIPEVRMLRNPQENNDTTFNVTLNEQQDEKERKEKRRKMIEENFNNKKSLSAFKRLGREFHIEMNTFLERKAFCHFEPIDLEANDSNSGLIREKSIDKRRFSMKKERSSNRLRTRRLSSISSVCSDDDVQLEEILDVGTHARVRENSWFKEEVPLYLQSEVSSISSGSRERSLTLEDHTTLSLGAFGFQSTQSDRQYISESDSTTVENEFESGDVRSLKHTDTEIAEQDIIEGNFSDGEEIHDTETETDTRFDFLSQAIREKRKKTKTKAVGELRNRLDSFDYFDSLKDNAEKLLTNQIRHQVQSVMTEIAIEPLPKKEQMSWNFCKSEIERQEEQAVNMKPNELSKNESSRYKEPQNQKRQSFDDISAELKALRQMRSCNFAIYLFDVVQQPLEVWIVTEFAHIGCLASFCEVSFPEGVPENVVKWLITPIILALAHLHRAKMIHRDIKPSNIVLTHSGIPKLCDFGMAKEFEKLPVYKTKGFCGTEAFAPPEAFGSRKLYGTNFDTWGLGITMLSLAYGVENPWHFRNGSKRMTNANDNIGLRNRRERKYLNYLSEKLVEEVGWLKIRKELLKTLKDDDESSKSSKQTTSSAAVNLEGRKKDWFGIEYVGLYKRLSLLEKRDIENPSNEEILILLFYRDMHRALTAKKQKAKAQQIKTIEKQLDKIKAIDSLDVGVVLATSARDVLAKDLQTKLAKGVPEFSTDRRQLANFVRGCLRLFNERPTAEELLEEKYIRKLAKAWSLFDSRMEQHLLEMAITGKFSALDNSSLGGPYFNVRGEFLSAGKQVALKIHERFR